MLAALAWGLTLLAGPAGGQAQDSDQLRFYLSGRLGFGILTDTRPGAGLGASMLQQLSGGSIGVNLNRYLGFEIAADAFETDLKGPDGRKIGEYYMGAFIPQARLRYPLLDGRLTPYVLAGVGVGHNEFNDRKPPGQGQSIRARDTDVVGAVGGGIEYFVGRDVAVGVEARYLVSRGREIEVQGRRADADLDAILTAVSLRLFYPDGPEAPAGPAHRGTDGRLYLALRLGGAVVARTEAGGGIGTEPENAAVGPFNAFLGGGMGYDFARYFGVEVVFDGYEPILTVRGLGRVAEYGFWTVMPQARVRYPVLDGRLVPYVVAGVGVGFSEVNDVKRDRAIVDVHGTDVAPAGALGVGLEYLLSDSIAVGAEVKYVVSPGHRITLNGRARTMDIDSLFTALGARIYFGRVP